LTRHFNSLNKSRSFSESCSASVHFCFASWGWSRPVIGLGAIRE
jgi:hypothetical protein